jgi:hypothetical protein
MRRDEREDNKLFPTKVSSQLGFHYPDENCFACKMIIFLLAQLDVLGREGRKPTALEFIERQIA